MSRYRPRVPHRARRAASPQFVRYNAALRRWPKEVFEELTAAGNLFTTTIYVLVSAVMKLSRQAKFPEGFRLYRGTGGRTLLPAQFSRADPQGRRGYVEWGFMSTTADRATAIQYSGVREGRPAPTVLEITVGPVDRGASIEVFSQYPGEREVLWVPLSLLAPDGPPRLEATGQGVVSLVAVRVNANLMASTIEEIVERKKRGPLASFRFILSDLGRALRGIAADERAEERDARPSTSDSAVIAKKIFSARGPSERLGG